MSEANDEDLKRYALRHGVAVTLSSGRTYNASGERRKMPAPKLPEAAPATPVVETKPVETQQDPRVAQLEAEVKALREMVAALQAKPIVVPAPAPDAKLPTGYTFEITQRDADGFTKKAVLKPIVPGKAAETLEDRMVERVMTRQ